MSPRTVVAREARDLPAQMEIQVDLLVQERCLLHPILPTLPMAQLPLLLQACMTIRHLAPLHIMYLRHLRGLAGVAPLPLLPRLCRDPILP